MQCTKYVTELANTVPNQTRTEIQCLVKATLQHYPDTPSKWLHMFKFALTGDFLPTLLNYEGTLQGLWSQLVNGINKDVRGIKLLPMIVSAYPMD